MATRSINEIVKDSLKTEESKEYNRIYYGREDPGAIDIKKSSIDESEKCNFEIAAYSFDAVSEEVRNPRVVKIGLIQHSIVLPTSAPIELQRKAIFKKIENILEVAASEGVKIVCLQETWSMPFFLCTKEKEKTADFAESANNGPSILFLQNLAKKLEMVIVSPILEEENGSWWNTAVVINENGKILGKHRKNHCCTVGSFSEAGYYPPGTLGHTVFATKYGKIAVNICYGRHHALNWLMFALNGAEIVFNPAATVSDFGISFWGIEARNAAVANSYFTCSINRVGTENFLIPEEESVARAYYGSSYATAPNGYITPSLSRDKDGLLIVQMDLNLCRQIKDHWGFQMTARLNDYARELNSKKDLLKM